MQSTSCVFTWFYKFFTDVEHAIYMALQFSTSVELRTQKIVVVSNPARFPFTLFLEFGSKDFLAFAQKVRSL